MESDDEVEGIYIVGGRKRVKRFIHAYFTVSIYTKTACSGNAALKDGQHSGLFTFSSKHEALMFLLVNSPRPIVS